LQLRQQRFKQRVFLHGKVAWVVGHGNHQTTLFPIQRFQTLSSVHDVAERDAKQSRSLA
jgi:uncharacterized protein (DUF39 family)